MALYETVFIARQDLTPEDVDSLVSKFSKIITEGGGKIISTEYWGLRNLAYVINKNSRGHYVLLNIDSNNSALSEMNRVIGYNEDVIRSITYKVEKHEEQSLLCVSNSAKNLKLGKNSIKKESSKLDLLLDQIQFDV